MVEEVFEKDKGGFALRKKQNLEKKEYLREGDWKLLSSSAHRFLAEAKGCGYSNGSFADIEFGASSLNLLRVQ